MGLKLKIVFSFIIIIVIYSCNYKTNSLLIGSGLENNLVTVIADKDTVYNKKIRSEEYLGLLFDVPLPHKYNNIDIYVDGMIVSRLNFKNNTKLNNKIIVNFNYYRDETRKYLISVSYDFI